MLLTLLLTLHTHPATQATMPHSLPSPPPLPLTHSPNRYVPYVGDSKRALDEYTSEIFLGGKNTIVLHNTCEDSLLAAPIILDLIILAELITRIELKKDGEPAFHGFHPIAVLLSYLTKARVGGGRCRKLLGVVGQWAAQRALVLLYVVYGPLHCD